MHGTLFGLETELAFSAVSEQQRGVRDLEQRRTEMIDAFFEITRERVRFLPEQGGSGMFFENGSRFYLDCGNHPELSTAECRTPAELVCWQLAGERVLAESAAELEKQQPGMRVALFRCNVDYSGQQTVWGCHESYLYKNVRPELPANLIPHLVSRIVFTGAGGFDNQKSMIEFEISPRVTHLTSAIGEGRRPGRGIFHAKDEPLARKGYKRLHLMCGESLSSQLSNYLKVGTTALVVRLIEAGARDGKRLSFQDPLAAMRQFSADPSCRATHTLEDGRRLSAVQVQREYLEMVERRADAPFMPTWTHDVCRRWRAVLDALEEDPESLATRLDWVTKRALFREHSRSWRRSLERTPLQSKRGAELCEIDMRFGELGERGLFHALQGAGALDHEIAELPSVEQAMTTAPPGARAEARGKAVGELHGHGGRYVVGWERVVDSVDRRWLDMTDPFEGAPRWQELPLEAEFSDRSESFGLGSSAYDAMNMPRAIRYFEQAVRDAADARNFEAEAIARFWCATAHYEAGHIGAVQTLVGPALSREEYTPTPATLIRLWSRYGIAMIERPARKATIDRIIEMAAETAGSAGGTGRSRVLMLRGRLHGARGEYSEAIATLKSALDELPRDPVTFAICSHHYWIVGFHLRGGDVDGAKRALARWKNEDMRTSRRSYAAGTLGSTEADVACADGRPHEALEIIRRTLDETGAMRAGRWKLAIDCAAVRAALAADELAAARETLLELQRGSNIEAGHLALEVNRLDALYHLKQARSDGQLPAPQIDIDAFADGPESTHEIASLPHFAQAYRKATSEARMLDDRLQTHRHLRELRESILAYT